MPGTIDEQEFLQAYDELADALFRHCYFRLFDREKAKDAVQDTFMRVWRHIAKGGRIDSLKAFLYRTATNIIIDERRKAKHRQHPSLDELKDTGIEPSHTPTETLHINIDASRLLQLCSYLRDEYQDVLIMRYVEGLMPADIARITGESTNTISVRLYRAIKQLQSLTPSYE